MRGKKGREVGGERKKDAAKCPGHPIAVSSLALGSWRHGSARTVQSCCLLCIALSYPSLFSLGLTLESPPPLPHSPLSYHHLFFNLSNRPCSFSFSTARLTAFLETIKHTCQTGWVNFRRFCLFCFLFLLYLWQLSSQKMKWEKGHNNM